MAANGPQAAAQGTAAILVVSKGKRTQATSSPVPARNSAGIGAQRSLTGQPGSWLGEGRCQTSSLA